MRLVVWCSFMWGALFTIAAVNFIALATGTVSQTWPPFPSSVWLAIAAVSVFGNRLDSKYASRRFLECRIQGIHTRFGGRN